MDYLDKMQLELYELENRIEKLESFLETESIVITPKTNEYQRRLMYIQLEHMKNYAKILEDRIRYEMPCCE